MGMSASQARLLSITSRLTDNELQSQLLTQSKMRLATKTQAVSDEYMDALSKSKLKIATYDSTGVQTYIEPTANYLYTYGELKNQYGLVDATGNFLVSGDMADKFKRSNNSLSKFLELCGCQVNINHKIVNDIENEENFQSAMQILFDTTDWTNSLVDVSDSLTADIFETNFVSTSDNTQAAQFNLSAALNGEIIGTQGVKWDIYNSVKEQVNSQTITDTKVQNYVDKLLEIKNIIREQSPQLDTNGDATTDANGEIVYSDKLSENCKSAIMNWYNEVLSARSELSTKKGADYTWYENLYYRMSSGYKVMDSSNYNNSEWLSYALTHGIVSMEQVKITNKNSATYPELKNRDWISVQYTACQDLKEFDDDIDVAKAEAQYTKAMNEIQAKDKDFDIKIKNLETIHNALMQEYDAVKQLISKNVERSYKTFSS